MISKFIKKLNSKFTHKLKEKRGASMAVVITSMSLLIILGTTFSTLAYSSYQHSFGNLCTKQATLTSKGVLDGFVEAFKTQLSLRQEVMLSLRTAVENVEEENKTNQNKRDIKTVAVKVKVSGLDSGMVDISKQDANNKCDIFVSYYDDAKLRLRVKSVAQYKGFKGSISAVLGVTNKAGKELAKIMSNALYFTSPIVDMMYYVDETKAGKHFIEKTATTPHPNTDYAVVGDVYVDAPYWPVDKDGNKIEAENPYTNVSALPIGGGKTELTGGHTLKIDNQGRPNVKYNDKGMPEYIDANASYDDRGVPNGLTDDNYIKDAAGIYKPLIDINGNIVYKIGDGDDVFKLQPNLKDFYYLRDTELVTNKLDADLVIGEQDRYQPERLIEPYDLSKIINLPTGFFIKTEDVKYKYSTTQGTTPKPFKDSVDINHKPLLGMKDEGVVDTEGDNGKYPIYATEQVWMDKNGNPTNNPEKKYKDYYLRDGITDIDWHYVEVYRTINPSTNEEIYVTGRIKNRKNFSKLEYNKKYSFRRVGLRQNEEKKDRVVLALHGKVDNNEIKFDSYESSSENWSEATNQPYYNFYKYQRTRYASVENEPEKAYKAAICPNEWSEVYLRGHYFGNINFTLPLPIVIDGDLKCNTDVLLGLDNRGRGKEPFTSSSHGFKNNQVAYDSADVNYTIAQYNALTLTGNIYANGNIKAENLIAGIIGSNKIKFNDIFTGDFWKDLLDKNKDKDYITKITSNDSNKGNVFAIDNNPNDDIINDEYSAQGCKGNVFLQQSQYASSLIGLTISGYLDVNNIVADGYVFVGGCPAVLSEKAQVRGSIYAGKYNPDGTRWGKRGTVLSAIPTNKFYFENESVKVAKDIRDDYPSLLPGGIYGYRTQAEVDAGRYNRYELGSGDVVLQQAYVHGNIYATGDVYLSNGVCVKGSIYTPGNVYITKGDNDIDTLRPNITSPTDPRCRVWGDIYAGGDVVITGGCEVGRFEAKHPENKPPELGYNSGIHCGGNLYIRGRIGDHNHDAVPGDVEVGGNLTVIGNKSDTIIKKSTRIAYRGGKIKVKGDVIVGPRIAFGGDNKDEDKGNPYKSFEYGGKYIETGTCWYHGPDRKYVGNWTESWFDFKGYPKREFSNTIQKFDKAKDDYKVAVSANVKKWSSPENDKAKYVDKTLDKFMPTDTSSEYKYIINENVKLDSPITLGSGEKLKIDTNEKNIHIVLNRDLTMLGNSQIIVDGKNMAFIYFEGNATKIDIGPNAVVGLKTDITQNNSGLHIISMTKDFEMVIHNGSKVYSSNYLPNGILTFNLGNENLGNDVRTASVANPTGSYTINRFKGENINAMYRWRIKFKQENSPLILDGNGEVQYGDTSDEITDYQEVCWELLGYE